MIGPFSPARLESVFQEHLDAGLEVGAAVSVWRGSEECLSLQGGFCDREGTTPWVAETLVPIWSATKGPAAATTLLVLEKAGLSPHDRVGRVWPAFDRSDKRALTFAHLLSHQAGLSALDGEVPVEDYEAVVAALEEQVPHWELGTGHGYHPRTGGYLLDEVVRLLAGDRLGIVWHREIATPFDLDVWIGLPESEDHRVAPLFAAKGISVSSDEKPFFQAYADRESLTSRAFRSPAGLAAATSMNQPEARRFGYPGMGGLATASGLARFYALLASGKILKPETLREVRDFRQQGPDRTLRLETAFSLGFMIDPVDGQGRKRRRHFGPNTGAFGHPGAGGSFAFADPASGTGFAYTMNQMELCVLPGKRARALVASGSDCLEAQS
ncbi:MAG: serine hydrolase domain-containing protein [Verrucomicrobiota bacterium]